MGTPADELRYELARAGVRAGDEVIVPSYDVCETAHVALSMGAEPVFTDIDPATFCVAPAAVDAAVSERTAAIVAVHTFGHPADMAMLAALGQRHDVPVVGHGMHAEPTAAIARRQAHARYLSARLKGVCAPPVRQGAVHGFQQYVVRVPGNGRPDRDAFARMLRARGVHCRVPVQTPVHRSAAFRRELWLAETERASDECLALPVAADMTRRDLQRVVAVCNGLGGLLQPAA
ncbi:DegT/DnrJ/EryC1/StrS family aminotransferase [Streptomyces zagrosensis]|uniref:dTDP-4-amino-4,6-dideoxygalactose transaminase n=1 Tax=Streptomyces zagrosensis TaxID=1042984 RepID=A0A7W9V0Q0_9ACTN|nr:DegT/DnrJ/EryC1/StrS family aminotransferase [Streptomyces zagrosensis]MBB5937486.1 dTDP-4-amino-4,6-dideoxygalactose transaminase [Streptomyces zagrosensis]